MLAPYRRIALRFWPMEAFHTLRLPPISVSPSPVTRCRNFGPMLAPEAATCRGCKSAGSSLLYISRGAARNVTGNAMNGEEGEVSSNGNATFAGERSPPVVLSFYKFDNLPDYEQKRAPLKELCETNFVSGGIILAPEGINGSLCGTREAVEVVMSAIQSDERLANLRRTEAPAGVDEEEIHNGHSGKSPLGAGENAPFRWDHVRVKLKKEVVSMGVPGVNPADKVGKYVKPKEWNKLISDPDTVVVDVRNSYEIRVGKFKRAVDPQTDSFRQFPAWVEEKLGDGSQSGMTNGLDGSQVEGHMLAQDQEIAQTSYEESEEPRSPRRIAMYCTGGIRCEKATSYLVNQGFDKVYHLEGGILKYLEETPASESLWEVHPWCGSMSAMKVATFELESGKYLHIDTIDFRDLVDLLRSYSSSIDISNMSLNREHKGPQSQLENALKHEAAGVDPSLVNRFHQMNFDLPVSGVRINCISDLFARGNQMFEAVKVPSQDPIWNAPITSISNLIGMPVKVRRIKPASDREEGNQAATFLHLNADPQSEFWGWAYPWDWQRPAGSCLVVHAEKKKLSPKQVEVLCSFCQDFLQPLFEESVEKPGNMELKNAVLRHLTPSSYAQFCSDFESGRPNYDDDVTE